MTKDELLITMPSILHNFLESRGALESFKKNYNMEGALMFEHGEDSDIDRAFCWVDSEEGYVYWHSLFVDYGDEINWDINDIVYRHDEISPENTKALI